MAAVFPKADIGNNISSMSSDAADRFGACERMDGFTLMSVLGFEGLSCKFFAVFVNYLDGKFVAFCFGRYDAFV